MKNEGLKYLEELSFKKKQENKVFLFMLFPKLDILIRQVTVWLNVF